MPANTKIEFAHLKTYFNSTHIESPTLQNSLKEIYKIMDTNGTLFVSIILNCAYLSWTPRSFTAWCNGFYILYNNPDNVTTNMSLGTFVLFAINTIFITNITGKKTDFSDAKVSQWYKIQGAKAV